MKSNRKTVQERQSRILELVNLKEEISVEELALACGVSPMTVRRDLSLLDANGMLRRLHGRAATLERAETIESPDPLVERCRECISRYAASLVNDSDVLFINGSRTALNLLRHLGRKRVNVYTNNGWAVMEPYPETVRLHMIGGELFGRIMIGQYVVQNLLQMSSDKTFIGCGGVYDDGEFRYDIPTEIGINEMMLSRTRGGFYILADHTKMQKREMRINTYGSCRYNHEVTLITDSMADPEMTGKLEAAGIHVVIVPVDTPGTV